MFKYTQFLDLFMDMVLIFGLAAGVCTTFAFLPQLLRVWKLKEARDLSLTTFVVFTLGVLLWLIYGIMKQDVAVILANMLTFVFASIILFFKIRYK